MCTWARLAAATGSVRGEPRERRAGVSGMRERNVGVDAEFGSEKVERGVSLEGWHAVLEGSERGGSLDADEILARREGLAEFDVQRGPREGGRASRRIRRGRGS